MHECMIERARKDMGSQQKEGKIMAKVKGAGRLVVITLAGLLFWVGFAASTVSAADVKPIELKWANFQTKEADSIPALMDWLKAIEARSKGA